MNVEASQRLFKCQLSKILKRVLLYIKFRNFDKIDYRGKTVIELPETCKLQIHKNIFLTTVEKLLQSKKRRPPTVWPVSRERVMVLSIEIIFTPVDLRASPVVDWDWDLTLLYSW
jgi:hypothetical protein